MNRNTHSAECAHGMHSACDYEDCACPCHREDDSVIFDEPFSYDEEDGCQ